MYVFSTREERRGPWEYFENQLVGCQKPWMVIGEFNSVLTIEDKIRGNRVTWAEVVDFNSCIEACGVI